MAIFENKNKRLYKKAIILLYLFIIRMLSVLTNCLS